MKLELSEQRPLRILTVEDDLDFAYLIQATLNREPDMQVAGHAADEPSALRLTEELSPDIVLMDLNLSSSPLDGVRAARNIRLRSDSRLIILTAYEDPDTVVKACKQSFASGYIFKSQFGCLAETIRRMAAGPTPQLHMIRSLILSDLSAAEQTVLQMLLGKDVNLRSSAKTIANQKSSILKKLGLRRQEELIHLMKNYL